MAERRFYHNFSHPKKAAFLAAFREGASVKSAAETSGVDRRQVYYWLEHDAAFLAAYGLAKVDAVESLEDAARRRAVDGIYQPIYNDKGDEIGGTTKYSDTLLIFLLKGLAPEKYRERVDVTQTQVVKAMDGAAWDAV